LILTGKGEGSGKQAAVDRDFSASVDGDEAAARRKLLIAFGWVIGLFLLILFLGFPMGITLFVLVYTKFQGKEKWLLSVVMAFFSWLFIWGLFIRLLHIPFQQGLVEKGLNLLGIG
jgi:ABC-type sugar transport system permease subunit